MSTFGMHGRATSVGARTVRLDNSSSNTLIWEPRGSSDATATILTSVDQLDLATVIKVSEEVSGEIVLEKLIHTLMRTAIEHAGATRGLLILPRGDDYRIEAEATTSTSEVNVELRQASVTAGGSAGISPSLRASNQGERSAA